jgi:hypothetical protein
MRKKLLVREVSIRRGCLSRRDDPENEPTLVCPLCTVEGKVHGQRTASLATSGHIWCNRGCGRYSTIVVRTTVGEVSLYPVNLMVPRAFDVQTQALLALKPALQGDGDLSDMVAMDDVEPTAIVGFVLPKLVLDQRAAADMSRLELVGAGM